MWYDHAYEEAKGHISENVKRSIFEKDERALWQSSDARPIIYKRGNICQ